MGSQGDGSTRPPLRCSAQRTLSVRETVSTSSPHDGARRPIPARRRRACRVCCLRVGWALGLGLGLGSQGLRYPRITQGASVGELEPKLYFLGEGGLGYQGCG